MPALDRDSLVRLLPQRPLYRVLLGVGCVLAVVRIALPYVLVPVLVSQADAALQGHVELADLDLSLLRGGVTLYGLRVHAGERASEAAPSEQRSEALPEALPDAEAQPSTQSPALEGSRASLGAVDPGPRSAPPRDAGPGVSSTQPVSASPDSMPPPVLAVERLWVEVSWLDLLSRTVRIEELELTDFVVHLEQRLAGLVLPQAASDASAVSSDTSMERKTELPATTGQALEAESEVTPGAEEDAAAASTGWGFAADRIDLRGGRITFEDYTTREGPQRFDLSLRDLRAENLDLSPAGSDGAPGRLSLEAALGDGTIRVDAEIAMAASGPSVTTNLTLEKIPLRNTRVYVTAFGWSELRGLLDASLQHRFETNGRHGLAGEAALSDVVVRVPKLDVPALAWRELRVEIADLDVIGQRAAVSRVRLDGAQVVLDLGASPVLPLLAAAERRPAASRADVAAASQPASAEGDESTPRAPWSWSVGQVELVDGRVDLAGREGLLPVEVNLAVRDLTSDTASRWPLELVLGGTAGDLRVAGALGVEPLAFEGKLAMQRLALPGLLTRTGVPAAALVQQGELRADLELALGPAEQAPNGLRGTDLRVAGTLGLADWQIGDPQTQELFAAAWSDLEIEIEDLAVRSLIAPDPASTPLRTRAVIRELRWRSPELRVTRRPEGLVLPGALAGSPRATPDAPAEVGPSESQGETPETASEVESADVAAPVSLRLDRLRIDAARIQVSDRAVEPVARTTIDQLDVRARRVAWPGPAAEQIEIDLVGMNGAKLRVEGSVGGGGSQLAVRLRQLSLAQLNPYIAASGYRVTAGALSLDSKAVLDAASYDTSTGLVLSDLEIGGAEGESRFQQNFGIPLSFALTLLRDLDGNITLSVPAAGNRDGTRVGLASVATQALRRALLGALQAPLKLLGAVVSAGRVQSLTPEPIVFDPGTVRLAEPGAERIAQLVELLAESPEIQLTLVGTAFGADAAVLRERALLDDLQELTGIRALRALGELGTVDAVRDHLAAKRAGRPAPELDAAQRAWLEEQLAAKAIDPADLVELAERRVEIAERALIGANARLSERIDTAPVDANAERDETPSGVALQIRTQP